MNDIKKEEELIENEIDIDLRIENIIRRIEEKIIAIFGNHNEIDEAISDPREKIKDVSILASFLGAIKELCDMVKTEQEYFKSEEYQNIHKSNLENVGAARLKEWNFKKNMYSNILTTLKSMENAISQYAAHLSKIQEAFASKSMQAVEKEKEINRRYDLLKTNYGLIIGEDEKLLAYLHILINRIKLEEAA